MIHRMGKKLPGFYTKCHFFIRAGMGGIFLFVREWVAFFYSCRNGWHFLFLGGAGAFRRSIVSLESSHVRALSLPYMSPVAFIHALFLFPVSLRVFLLFHTRALSLSYTHFTHFPPHCVYSYPYMHAPYLLHTRTFLAFRLTACILTLPCMKTASSIHALFSLFASLRVSHKFGQIRTTRVNGWFALRL